MCLRADNLYIDSFFQDDKCFIWSTIAAVYGDVNVHHPHRVSHYREHEHKLNMEGIEMPMKLSDIPRFERQNDISVSVYGWEKGKSNDDDEEEPDYVYTLRVAREVKARHADLLLIANDKTQHYCWIKNFSRLVSTQYTANGHEHAYCRFCLHGFVGKAIAGNAHA